MKQKEGDLRRRTNCSKRNKVWTPSRRSHICWRCGRLSLVSLHHLRVLNRPSNLSTRTQSQPVHAQRAQTFPNSKSFELEMRPRTIMKCLPIFPPQARLLDRLQKPHLFKRDRHPYKACRRRSDLSFHSCVILTGFGAPTIPSSYQRAPKARPLIFQGTSAARNEDTDPMCADYCLRPCLLELGRKNTTLLLLSDYSCFSVVPDVSTCTHFCPNTILNEGLKRRYQRHEQQTQAFQQYGS